MRVPEAIGGTLTGWPHTGTVEQVFPFVTVDVAGFPHVCLLSRAEVDPGAHEIRVVLASIRTRTNLGDRPRATLIVVEGNVAHYCKMSVLRRLDGPTVTVAALSLDDHIADELGVTMAPMSFHVPVGLSVREHWYAGRSMLRDLARGEHLT